MLIAPRIEHHGSDETWRFASSAPFLLAVDAEREIDQGRAREPVEVDRLGLKIVAGDGIGKASANMSEIGSPPDRGSSISWTLR